MPQQPGNSLSVTAKGPGDVCGGGGGSPRRPARPGAPAAGPSAAGEQLLHLRLGSGEVLQVAGLGASGAQEEEGAAAHRPAEGLLEGERVRAALGPVADERGPEVLLATHLIRLVVD